MEVANLNVVEREEQGRRQVAKVRAAGKIPAVIYGKDRENIHLSIPGHEFAQLVSTHHKLFQLHYPSGRTVDAFLQDLQWDALADGILHADFLRISLDEKMQSDVELHFVGQPKGLAKNGVFDTTLNQLKVECLPKDLPEEIRIVVNVLEVGDSIYVKDLELPEGVVALDEPEALVCQCKLRHAGMDVDEAEEEPEAEDGAEPEVIGKKDESANE